MILPCLNITTYYTLLKYLQVNLICIHDSTVSTYHDTLLKYLHGKIMSNCAHFFT